MRALALVSSGLDSILAVKVVQNQKVEVVGLRFIIPFHSSLKVRPVPSLDIGIRQIDISSELLAILKKPRFGFGSQINPCIDCRILMLSKAKGLMSELGADFVITGEVLGQRPFSQHRRALEVVAKESGLAGLLVRPLSARLLPETIPEMNGWLNRQELFDFQGRSRKPQLELARSMGIKEFLQPAGGCLLTEPEFARRIKDLKLHNGLSNLKEVELLKMGRHFRLSEKTKLIVGRDVKENSLLEKMAEQGDYLIYPEADLPGPTALAKGCSDLRVITLAARIVCRYCDLGSSKMAKVCYQKVGDGFEEFVEVAPIEPEAIKTLRI